MPFLQEIEKLPFFWGKLDQKEAEKTLSDKPIGSFLLRLEKNGYITLSVHTKKFKIVDYVPYGMNKSEKDAVETIIKAIKELTPAKYPVLRKMPSLFVLSSQEISKNVDAEEDLEQLNLPPGGGIIASMKEGKNNCLLKGFEIVCSQSDWYRRFLEGKSKSFIPSGIKLTNVDIPNVQGFEGQNTELDNFMPPLISWPTLYMPGFPRWP